MVKFNFSKVDNTHNLHPQIKNYLSRYIKNRLEDFNKVKSDHSNFLLVRDYCHKVIGSARSYNLHQLEEITLELQKLARNEDQVAIKKLLIDYEQYLQDISDKYLQKS